MLIILNVVPLDPFPPVSIVIRLSETPVHPEAGPETVARSCTESPLQIV